MYPTTKLLTVEQRGKMKVKIAAGSDTQQLSFHNPERTTGGLMGYGRRKIFTADVPPALTRAPKPRCGPSKSDLATTPQFIAYAKSGKSPQKPQAFRCCS